MGQVEPAEAGARGDTKDMDGAKRWNARVGMLAALMRGGVR